MEIQLKAADSSAVARTAPRSLSVLAWLRAVTALFKPRIGISIALSALGGAAVAGSDWPTPEAAISLLLAVLLASFGAAGFNHYLERDLDARMRRTRKRPFASGLLQPGPAWPMLFSSLIAGGSGLAAWRFGLACGLFVLAGALTYVLVYTAWLKRRTDWNIVIGGAAGSWAVLAGGAAVHAEPFQAAVAWLALVLLLWTPSHFWPLAIALSEDYRRAGFPMLPVTRGAPVAARWVLGNAILLVLASVGLGVVLGSPLYWLFSTVGSAWLLVTVIDLVRDPVRARAMTAFFASLAQLGLLLGGIFLNATVG